MRPRAAMLLAAGLGTRMRPLTEQTPKPLLTLGGRALLDHAIDRLAAIGIERVVVNAHWQAPRLAAHLAARQDGPALHLREEPTLLDTGGAVASALARGDLGPEPFFVVNGDAFWLDGPTPALARLAAAFDAAMEGVLLLHRTCQVQAEAGRGDFALDPWGVPRRPAPCEIVPYIYAGVQLVAPALFAAPPAGAFSLNVLWNRALAAGRLRALVHDGLWFHLSTPADLHEAEERLRAGVTLDTR
jgi:MurNAc alpha-1-phosphate uridylyltransferase